jgi:hypothetical protein
MNLIDSAILRSLLRFLPLCGYTRGLVSPSYAARQPMACMVVHLTLRLLLSDNSTLTLLTL